MVIQDKKDIEIYSICAKVIDSKSMSEAKSQVHHHCTSLYDHIMRVARNAVDLCDKYEKNGRAIDRKSVITAAVCHDIGIIGRERKFKSVPDAWFSHAKMSAFETERFMPDVDIKTLKMIKKHMWPISIIPPTTMEEWIIIKADKKASIYEFRNRKQLKKLMNNP